MRVPPQPWFDWVYAPQKYGSAMRQQQPSIPSPCANPARSYGLYIFFMYPCMYVCGYGFICSGVVLYQVKISHGVVCGRGGMYLWKHVVWHDMDAFTGLRSSVLRVWWVESDTRDCKRQRSCFAHARLLPATRTSKVVSLNSPRLNKGISIVLYKFPQTWCLGHYFLLRACLVIWTSTVQHVLI